MLNSDYESNSNEYDKDTPNTLFAWLLNELIKTSQN